jgi:mevalonate kinase
VPSTEATAPGKIILFGEHAVVYGRPAIAAPLMHVRAQATVESSKETGIRLCAPNLGRDYWLEDARKKDPLAKAVYLVLAELNLPQMPNLAVTIRSAIPIASGLGSGASMAAAVIRATYNHLSGQGPVSDATVSSLTYQVERILHGTPSGIDNTVVAFERPIFFVRQEPENRIEMLDVTSPIHLLIADTGVVSKTRMVVGDVRRQWKENRDEFERLFDQCGEVTRMARPAIELGDMRRLGQLMSENQSYLRQLTVSSPELETLITTAEKSGALGAKLSGAGRGGNMIALVTEGSASQVRDGLLTAGALGVLESVIG